MTNIEKIRAALEDLTDQLAIMAKDPASNPFVKQGKEALALLDAPAPAQAEALERAAEMLFEYEQRHDIIADFFTWPEHENDVGYRGDRGYVTLAPSDIQYHCRKKAQIVIRAYQERTALQSRPRIKPLVWEKCNTWHRFTCETIIGDYEVLFSNGLWFVSHCPHDENLERPELGAFDLEYDAKAAAEAHWQAKIGEWLG